MLLIDTNNHRKPEDADNLMDRMRELQGTTEDIDEILREISEEGFDDETYNSLMKELDQSIAEDQYQTAGEQIPEFPQVPKQMSILGSSINKPKRAVTPVKQLVIPQPVDNDLDMMLSNL